MSRDDLINTTRAILAKGGYDISPMMSLRSVCFDVVGRKGDTLLIIKILSNVDAFSRENAEEMKVLAEMLHACPLLIGERSSSGLLEPGIVYSRFNIQIISNETLADHILENAPPFIFAAPGDKPQVNINGMSQHLREVKYIANIAENYGFETLAFDLEKRLAAYYEGEISKSNRSKLAELDATLGNRELSDKVAQETRRAEQASRIIVLLTVVILGGALLFSWLHIRRLKLANEKVRLANEAKTRFVQNMSHEVRTPLNAIVGFSQLLSLPDGSFTETEKDDFARHIVNNSKMLTMLLDDILNTSAMDAGSYRIVYEPSECKYMCEAALSSVEHRVQPGVKLYFVPESEHPCPVTTDPRRVQQILINMLTNACKHTAKGEIKLTYSTADEPGFIQFSVTDTGTGVPADQAEAIFGRFTKLNEFVQGTGLGLSICREIAEKMGGKVYLDTTYTQGGARFVFSIPVNPPVQTV